MDACTATTASPERYFAQFIELAANLVGLRDPGSATYCHAVADQSKTLALRLGMAEDAANDVFYAGLMHHIGKLGLPDHLFNKPYKRRSDSERAVVKEYPRVAASLMASIESLHGVAECVRHQNTRFDASHRADGVYGEKIPLGARVLSVVKGYHTVQRGGFDGRSYSVTEARQFLRENRGRRYDPAVVDMYLEVLEALTTQLIADPVDCLSSGDLVQGMVLARDILSEKGAVLLKKDYVLSVDTIERLRLIERNWKEEFIVFVWRKRSD